MKSTRDTQLTTEARRLAPMLGGTLLMSIFINLSYFAFPLYMMQMSERVMASRNLLTLAFLTAIALIVLAFGAIVDALRARMFQAAAYAIDLRLSSAMFDVLSRFPSSQSLILHQTAAADLQALRDFVGGSSIPAVLDCLFAPFFIALMFLLHPLLGFMSVGILLVQLLLSTFNQASTYHPARRARDASQETMRLLSSLARVREEAKVMGMLPHLEQQWSQRRKSLLGWQSVASSRAGIFVALTRFIRNTQGIALLCLGVWLALERELTMGAAFAGMIIMQRGIAPLEAVVTNWRGYNTAWLAYRRLNEIFYQVPSEKERVILPRPEGRLGVSQAYFAFPGKDMPVLNGVSFAVETGRIMAVVGPSGAGKSTLARILVGALRPKRGSISLGDTDISHWNPDQLGPYLGYMPQQTEFLPGTVADNISRFAEPSAERDAAVVAAIETVGAQELVSSLPQGYNTFIGPDEYQLSSGQKQRLALARAVYGDPVLVVLDEPNANLDTHGEQALGETLGALRKKGVTTVVVTHRMNMLVHCDDVLVLNAGSVHTFGPRDQIMRRLPPLRTGAALTVVDGDLSKGQAS